MSITPEAGTWVTTVATALNAVVLAAYAYFTWGIWRETRRSAERTELLARQARDAFRLQILVAYQEEIRSAKEHATQPGQQLGAAWTGVGLIEQALRVTFPEEWPEIRRILDTAAEEWLKQTGSKG